MSNLGVAGWVLFGLLASIVFGEFMATRSVFESYKQQDDSSRRRERYCKARSPIVDAYETAEGKATDKQATEDRQSELCQQWRSAEAAEEAARIAWLQLFVAGFGLLGVGAAAYYAANAYLQARRQADAAWVALDHASVLVVEARAQTLLANPPRLCIRHITIEGKDGTAPSSFSAGQRWKGSAQASNIGTAGLRIDKDHIICMWFWCEGPLPMRRPYDEPRVTDEMRGVSEPFKVEYGTFESFGSGAHGKWEFTVVVPSTYGDGMDLYVMGRFLGIGEKETRYTTLFARKYDLAKRRFVSIEDNEDYVKYE